MNFGYAVDGTRPLDAEVWGRVTRRRRTKRSNGAWDKEAQAVLQGQVQNVVKAWMDGRTSEWSWTISNVKLKVDFGNEADL